MMPKKLIADIYTGYLDDMSATADTMAPAPEAQQADELAAEAPEGAE